MREIERGAIGEIDQHLVMAVFEHVKEGRAAPVLRGVALAGRAVFEGVALVGLDVVPAKPAALEDRMQRIDEDEAARQIEALGPAALAEAAQQVVLGQAGEALADQPVHQTAVGVRGPCPIMPRNRARRKLPQASDFRGLTTSPSSLTNEAAGWSSRSSTSFRRPAQSCALRRHHDRPVDQDRMRQHEVDQFVVAPFRIGEPKFRIRRALLRATAREPEFPSPRSARSAAPGSAGSLRYSITSGSSPLCRIMASVLREVPQSGL